MRVKWEAKQWYSARAVCHDYDCGWMVTFRLRSEHWRAVRRHVADTGHRVEVFETRNRTVRPGEATPRVPKVELEE